MVHNGKWSQRIGAALLALRAGFGDIETDQGKSNVARPPLTQNERKTRKTSACKLVQLPPPGNLNAFGQWIVRINKSK